MSTQYTKIFCSHYSQVNYRLFTRVQRCGQKELYKKLQGEYTLKTSIQLHHLSLTTKTHWIVGPSTT